MPRRFTAGGDHELDKCTPGDKRREAPACFGLPILGDENGRGSSPAMIGGLARRLSKWNRLRAKGYAESWVEHRICPKSDTRFWVRRSRSFARRRPTACRRSSAWVAVPTGIIGATAPATACAARAIMPRFLAGALRRAAAGAAFFFAGADFTETLLRAGAFRAARAAFFAGRAWPISSPPSSPAVWRTSAPAVSSQTPSIS